MVIGLQYFRYVQRVLVIQCDDADCAIDDYTIFVKQIPIDPDVDYEKELK